MEPNEVDWDFFQAAFKKKYLGVRYLDDKKREFMSLVQGNMTVAEYEVQFVRLSPYAPDMVLSDMHRCDRFRYGLVQEVKTFILASEYTYFDVLVTRCKDIEQSLGLTSRIGGSSSSKRAADSGPSWL
ncbi:hypothetical protein HRI_004503700 [Hibiscus trionum]|uniref:Retrotransposon gag domain-containing protein n=1 Tax=Hibiscus trionum TaxID=183268 RepID=A0A9W7J5A4_HIBTR|nr:hypothetical protein HRI_004503700 [Hibiscus trionum]